VLDAFVSFVRGVFDAVEQVKRPGGKRVRRGVAKRYGDQHSTGKGDRAGEVLPGVRQLDRSAQARHQIIEL
jgi:hypothetical protein